nr:global nitrogen transcriptional regulator [Ahnfeltia fastigiata]
MKWINSLSKEKVPFQIYKLNKGDAIISRPDYDNSKLLIILDGYIYLMKVFTNKETLSIGILNTNSIIDIKFILSKNKHYYYKALAISSTFIISFEIKNILNLKTLEKRLIEDVLKSYILTIAKYEIMTNILAHKDIKNRLIQLLLILCEECGVIKNHYIIIPLKLSHSTLSLIIGSNRVTIARLMKRLQQRMLISYTDQQIQIHNPIALSYFNNIHNKS